MPAPRSAVLPLNAQPSTNRHPGPETAAVPLHDALQSSNTQPRKVSDPPATLTADPESAKPFRIVMPSRRLRLVSHPDTERRRPMPPRSRMVAEAPAPLTTMS